MAVEQDAALTGVFGVNLRRSPTNCSDVFLTTIHRILVEPGSKLSVVGATRARGGGDLRLQLSWYADTEGPSGQQTLVDIPDRERWKHFIVDATVPDYAVAVGLYLRLSPSTAADTSADVDDLALVAWHAGAPSAVDQYLRALDAPTRLTFSQSIPPGSHARPTSSPTYISAGITTAPSPRPTASTRARC